MNDYQPPDRLRGGHWMTLYTWGRPRHFPRLPDPVIRYFDVAPHSRVLAHCHWQPRAYEHPVLMVLHGLEGSSQAHYMLGIADKAWARRFNVVRLNQRNCGGTDSLSEGLYHSGLTADPMAVMRELIEVDGVSEIVVAGYSLGGNLALKLAGDYGDQAPRVLRAVAAVSPTLDLARCVDALERRSNRLYEWNFVRNLKRRIRRKARLFPGRFPVERLRAVRTVREFDEAFTAPCHGFRDAADYYHRASALRVVDRIHVPALIVSAADDPFVPPEQFSDPALVDNRWISVRVTPAGGHCGFVAADRNGYDGYWAERVVVDFAASNCSSRAANTGPVPASSCLK